MSNKEAAEILKYLFPPVSRCDNKSTSKLVITMALNKTMEVLMALNKAIEVLENTPETNPKD